MDALDLTRQPPRPPRVPLADLDLLMAARSVDKIRATLEGGNLGDYQIKGFTQRFFDTLGIDETDFRSVVALAQSDADVAAWLRKHCPQAKMDEYNRIEGARSVRDRIDDAAFIEKYPLAAQLPLETPLVDMMTLDDELSFRA
jgi:hypothetical protein